MAKKSEYSNESIVKLKDEERVRLRPAVIFGSDGLEGCEHSFFEILSKNSSQFNFRYLCEHPFAGMGKIARLWEIPYKSSH